MADWPHFLGFFQEIVRLLACGNGAVAFLANSLDGRRIFQCGNSIRGQFHDHNGE